MTSSGELATFVCPACDREHRHPDDVSNRYCAVCHWPTGDPLLGPLRPELFTRNGKPAPPNPLTQLLPGS
jgi:hypothetical protein